MCGKFVTLVDGSRVFQAVFNETIEHIQDIKSANYIALVELVEKCKNPEYQFLCDRENDFSLGNSKIDLQQRNLVNESGNVDDDVRKIILNFIEGEGWSSLRFVNPLQSKKINRLCTIL